MDTPTNPSQYTIFVRPLETVGHEPVERRTTQASTKIFRLLACGKYPQHPQIALTKLRYLLAQVAEMEKAIFQLEVSANVTITECSTKNEMSKTSRNHKLAILFFLLSIGWVIALFIESSQPPASFIGAVDGLDKVAHFVAFGVLAMLLCTAFACLGLKTLTPLILAPLLITMLAGVIEEGYQMTVPGRASSVDDLLADVCGAVFGVVLFNRSGALRLISMAFK